MLRISKLIRPARLLNKVPLRAGLPGWDRPDPPPSVCLQVNHEISDDEIVFFFPDASMPEYVLTEPQIYVGDTFEEGAKNFFKNWAIFLGGCTLIGSLIYIAIPLRSDRYYSPSIIPRAKRDQENVDNKVLLERAKKNPMGLSVNTESYPSDYHLQVSQMVTKVKEGYERITKPNEEVRNYLTQLKAKCAQKVKNRNNHEEAEHH